MSVSLVKIPEGQTLPTVLLQYGSHAPNRATNGLVCGGDDQPMPGDTSYMGYSGMVSSYTTFDIPCYVEVPNTAWGDYCGSAVGRSNCRSLLRDFPNTFVHVSGDYGSEYLALPLDVPIDEYLLDVLVALRDEYPLYDEDDHSRLEVELMDEAWEGWVCHDLARAIGEYGVEIDADVIDYGMFGEIMSELGEWPYAETATDIAVPNLDRIAEVFAERLSK